MKKIDIQNSLRERVKSTEWTDKDTWNVLDRIRATGKTREKHRLTFLVPAAAMLILAVCIGVTSIVNPGTPDLIRPTAHTVQPLANTQSGDSASGSGDEITEAAVPTDEEAAVSSLRDCYPEIADALKPVNAVCEDQGIRVEIVSALVKDNSSWMLWTMQDLDGKRINDSSAGIFNHPNNIGEVADYGYSYSYYNAEEKKLTVLEEIRYDSMNEPEDGMYLLSANSVYTHEYETVDMKPLLEKYKSVTEGVSPPSGAWPSAGVMGDPVPQDLKVLDYESPANVSLTGKGRLLLTGIGWVNGKLHVQIHEADPAFCGIDDDGISLLRNNSVFITNCSAEGKSFGQSGDSPYVWEGSEGRWDQWLEFVFESTPDDEETMTLSAELIYTAKAASGTWEFRIPVSTVRDGGDPAVSGSVSVPEDEAGMKAEGTGLSADGTIPEETDVNEASETAGPEGAGTAEAMAAETAALSCEEYFHNLLTEINPEIAEGMKPVHYACEHDGIRMEIVSAMVRGNESWVFCTLQDLEGNRVNESTTGVVDRTNNIGNAESYPDYFSHYSTSEHKFGYLEHICYSRIDQPEDGQYVFGVNSVYTSAGKEEVDLMPFLEQYGKTVEGIDPRIDVPLYSGPSGESDRKGLKLLDYRNPLNIRLGSRGDLFLTGIGWIDNQLHVQIHVADPQFCAELGNVYDRLLFTEVKNYRPDGEAFEYADISPLEWDSPENFWEIWEETVLESTPDDVSGMTLYATMFYDELSVTGEWEVRVPVSLILADN